MTTLILVIVVVGILILVHEWGHFFAARKLGVKVEEFGFGFPPRIFSRVKNGVRYSVNVFPFGGFVKIFGEQGEGAGMRESFIGRPAWTRFIILAAGIVMNMATAWILFSVAAGAGVPKIADEYAPSVPISVLGVEAGSPAEKAGIKLGDMIVEMRRRETILAIETEKDVQDFVAAYRGEEITLKIRRGSEIREIKAVPRHRVSEGEGPLGIALGQIIMQSAPWYLAPLEGLWSLGRATYGVGGGIMQMARDLVLKGGISGDVSGPIGIFFFVADARTLGAGYLLQFMGVLAVNLAILNALPIPALDGGRILFLVIEKIKRKRIRPEVENTAHMIGFLALILLMALVTWRDIARLL